MKSDRHPSGCFVHSILTQFRFCQRGMVSPLLFHKFALRPHLALDFVNMIELIGEGCVNLGERERRNMRNDLVGSHPLVLMPANDVKHSHAMARNASSSTTDARRLDDSLRGGISHV
jgi:hypothetical protein